MHELHHEVVLPLLRAVDARRLVEVGADQGQHTALLQSYCDEVEGQLEVIDPGPLSGPLRELADHPLTTIHIGTSLEWIPRLAVPDVVLIDGDHNYYTVRGELDAVAARAAESGRPFPLVLLHDVGWPYGRRDMYYEPARVPQEHAHPYAKGALQLGRSELVREQPGFNAGFCNALHEGGPRNGVLTAVEDFSSARGGLLLLVVPGLHGLAVLASSALVDARPELREVLEQISGSPILIRVLELVERRRLEAESRIMQEAWHRAQAEAELVHLKERLAAGTGQEAEATAQQPSTST